MADDGYIAEMMVVKIRADNDIKIVVDRALIDYYLNLGHTEDPPILAKETKLKDAEPAVKKFFLPNKDAPLLGKDTPNVFLDDAILKEIKLSDITKKPVTELVYVKDLPLKLVPEPSSLLALLGGVSSLALFRKRRG